MNRPLREDVARLGANPDAGGTASGGEEHGARLHTGQFVTWWSELTERRFFGHCAGIYARDGNRVVWQVRTCNEDRTRDGRNCVAVVAEEFLRAIT